MKNMKKKNKETEKHTGWPYPILRLEDSEDGRAHN